MMKKKDVRIRRLLLQLWFRADSCVQTTTHGPTSGFTVHTHTHTVKFNIKIKDVSISLCHSAHEIKSQFSFLLLVMF